MSLAGLKVLSLESRRAAEMEALIQRWQGDAFVAPSVQECPHAPGEAIAWAERLMAGEFDLVIFTTGVGLQFLRDAILTKYTAEDFSAALNRVTVAVRGPKPLTWLSELKVRPEVRIPEPNTWREFLPLIAERPERRISIQQYGRPNHEFNDALKELGASVDTVSIYRWELPDNIGPLKEATRRLARRDFDVVIFTTSIQLTHLYEVATNLGVLAEVQQTLARDVVIASVGPVMTAALREHGLEPDIIPEHPKMAALVRSTALESAVRLAAKRGVPVQN
jgi:uroporphyrinogen-III synthase